MIVFSARKNQLLVLSSEQYDILIGCILGDGYITKLGKVQIEQGINQKDYIEWKHKKLRSISYPGDIATVKRFDKRTQKQYISLRFWTRQYFRTLRSIFYNRDGTKIFPNDLFQLSSRTLAVWYMDDGSFSGNECILATDGFSDESRLRIKRTLENNFGIQCSILHSGKLRIKNNSLGKFFSTVKQFIVPAMRYKIS